MNYDAVVISKVAYPHTSAAAVMRSMYGWNTKSQSSSTDNVLPHVIPYIFGAYGYADVEGRMFQGSCRDMVKPSPKHCADQNIANVLIGDQTTVSILVSGTESVDPIAPDLHHSIRRVQHRETTEVMRQALTFGAAKLSC